MVWVFLGAGAAERSPRPGATRAHPGRCPWRAVGPRGV